MFPRPDEGILKPANTNDQPGTTHWLSGVYWHMEQRKYIVYIYYSIGVSLGSDAWSCVCEWALLIQTQLHISYILFSSVIHNDLLKPAPAYQQYLCVISLFKQYMFSTIQW